MIDQINPTDATDDPMVTRAAEIGTEKGKAAASWVFDGNTSDETYRKVLAGIEDGDPEVLDTYRAPNLSGEFSGEYDEDDLQSEIGLNDAEINPDEREEIGSEAANAFNDAASTAFWDEIERMAREHVVSERAEKLRDAGYEVRYAYRPADGSGYVSPYDVRDYEDEGSETDAGNELFVELEDIARDGDTFNQTSTLERSNYRSLTRDYPESFTPISYSNTNGLAAFVADLDDDLTETLCGLKADYPVYDESDMSDLESEEIEESYDQYAGHDMASKLPEEEDNYWVYDQWFAMSADACREMFWEVCSDLNIRPDHDGHDVLWTDEMYADIAEEITRRLTGC